MELTTSERVFQNAILDLCQYMNIMAYHVRDSRRVVTSNGFPDLVLSGTKGTIFAELKAQKGRLSAAQIQWTERLSESGAQVFVWRPSDWPDIVTILKSIA